MKRAASGEQHDEEEEAGAAHLGPGGATPLPSRRIWKLLEGPDRDRGAGFRSGARLTARGGVGEEGRKEGRQ